MNGKDVLPNFLVIGAQRCATSWMYFCLKEHPDIFLPFIKELHFFNNYYEKGLEWYKRYFNTWSGQKAIGEISPGYLYIERSPRLIYRHLKDVRLIVCLRNPIERAYSQYKKHLRSELVLDSFEVAIEKDSQYIQRGFYFEQINRYLKYFPRERMLFLVYEDIQKDPLAFLKNIFSFLEVNSDFVPSCIDKIILSEDLKSAYTYIHRTSLFLRDRMYLAAFVDFVKKSYLQKMFDRFFNSEFAFNVVRPGIKSDKVTTDPINEETRRMMNKIFLNENKKLSDFIGRDLSSWV